MFKKNLLFLCLTLCVWGGAVSAEDETLTIQTYYPSPNGVYKQLKTNQLTIGSNYRNSTYADGSLYVEGNVGIGTSAPTDKIHIVGPIGETYLAFQRDLAPTRKWQLGLINDNQDFCFFEDNFSPSRTTIQAIFYSGGDIELAVSGGNVGVGVNPAAKLDVNGDIHLIGAPAAMYSIKNVKDPVNSQDVATKNYVDNKPKMSIRLVIDAKTEKAQAYCSSDETIMTGNCIGATDRNEQRDNSWYCENNYRPIYAFAICSKN